MLKRESHKVWVAEKLPGVEIRVGTAFEQEPEIVDPPIPHRCLQTTGCGNAGNSGTAGHKIVHPHHIASIKSLDNAGATVAIHPRRHWGLAPPTRGQRGQTDHDPEQGGAHVADQLDTESWLGPHQSPANGNN